MPGCNKRYSRAGRLKIHMRLHVSIFNSFFNFNYRLGRGRSCVLRMDAKRLLGKREIFWLIWGFIMGKNHSNVISLTATIAFRHGVSFKSTKKDTKAKDLTSAGTATTSSWDLAPSLLIWRSIATITILHSIKMNMEMPWITT